jgi:predicted metal-dependent phosphotriesterase family hydrolase
MSTVKTTKQKFTPEEEARIRAAVKAQSDTAREALIEAEIRNRLLDEQRTQPGYTGY